MRPPKQSSQDMKTFVNKIVRGVICGALFGLIVPVFCACHYERDDETLTQSTPQTSSNVDPKNLPSFYVDSVNGGTYRAGSMVQAMTDGGEITVQGWAVDPKNKKPATALFAVLDGKREFAVLYGQERADVAAFFNEANYADSGFTAKVPTAGLTKGKHTLTFRVVSDDGSYSPNWKIDLVLQ
jgi:hypothetical protein